MTRRRPLGNADQQLVDEAHSHPRIREQHLQVGAGHVLEELDDRRPRLERQVLDVPLALGLEVGRVLELHKDDNLAVVGELDGSAAKPEQVLHLLLPGVLATPVEHDLLEVVEVGFQADLHQRLLDERAVEVVGADALEVRVLGQSGQPVDQTLLCRLTLGGVQLADRARAGVRIERVVGVLQCFEPAAELMVQQAGQQLGEGPERLPVRGRYLIRAHRHDAGLAERDESLTGHCGPLCTAPTHPGTVAAPGNQVDGPTNPGRGTCTATRRYRAAPVARRRCTPACR